MRWKGFAMPKRGDDGRIEMRPYDIEQAGHNEPRYRARVEPGSSCQGPARDLARFYECLLGFGPRLLDPKTVEVMIACHRYGMRDAMFANLKVPWGLGVNISGTFNGGPGRRAFGHGGLGSSRGMADPDAGLVVTFIATGLPEPIVNEQRHYLVTDGVYSAFGDEVAHLRRPGRPPIEAEVTYSG
jgi:CubicO group peptidase (beta-lactamase class C family)